MNRDWQKEWAAFQGNCLNELRGSSKHIDSIARLWYFPSFEACMSWAIQPNHKSPETFILQRTTWDQMLDLEKFGLHNPLEELKTRLDRAKGIGPVPSIAHTELTASTAGLDAILAQGQDVRVPLLLPRNGIFGCDGSTYGFASGGFFRSSAIEWWQEGPEEWQPFIAWWHRLQEIIEAHFDST